MNYADFFKKIKTIAVVGLSDNPERYSYKVAKYLLEKEFVIIPVNPNIDNFLNIKAFGKLTEINRKVDVVDIFRKSEFVGQIVEDAIAIGAKSVWMQEGVTDDKAAEQAQAAGLIVVQNMCMMKEYEKIKE